MNSNARWKQFLIWWNDERFNARKYSGAELRDNIDAKIEEIKKQKNQS